MPPPPTGDPPRERPLCRRDRLRIALPGKPPASRRTARDEVERLLHPFRVLDGDRHFWEHAREGLAVRVADGRAWAYLLSRPVRRLSGFTCCRGCVSSHRSSGSRSWPSPAARRPSTRPRHDTTSPVAPPPTTSPWVRSTRCHRVVSPARPACPQRGATWWTKRRTNRTASLGRRDRGAGPTSVSSTVAPARGRPTSTTTPRSSCGTSTPWCTTRCRDRRACRCWSRRTAAWWRSSGGSPEIRSCSRIRRSSIRTCSAPPNSPRPSPRCSRQPAPAGSPPAGVLHRGRARGDRRGGPAARRQGGVHRPIGHAFPERRRGDLPFLKRRPPACRRDLCRATRHRLDPAIALTEIQRARA